MLPKLLLDMIPEMFYWVEVWGLGRPFHDCDSMVFEPGFGLLAGMLWVIVLLENDVGWGFVVVGEGSLEIIFPSILQVIPTPSQVIHPHI